MNREVLTGVLEITVVLSEVIMLKLAVIAALRAINASCCVAAGVIT